MYSPYTETFDASTVKLGSVCRDSSAFSEIALSEVLVVSMGTQGTRGGHVSQTWDSGGVRKTTCANIRNFCDRFGDTQAGSRFMNYRQLLYASKTDLL